MKMLLSFIYGDEEIIYCVLPTQNSPLRLAADCWWLLLVVVGERNIDTFVLLIHAANMFIHVTASCELFVVDVVEVDEHT